MSDHTPEAIAAYPEIPMGGGMAFIPEDERTAYDRGAADAREKAADLADRWLSNASNFRYAFVGGSFCIERNDVANNVPAAIRAQTPPKFEPVREPSVASEGDGK